MESFISALGKGSDWRACVINLLADAGEIPASANLAFIYITATLAPDLTNILGYLRSNTRVTHWVGTTGTGICHNHEEIYDVPAISALISSFPQDSFQVLELDDKPNSEFNAHFSIGVAMQHAKIEFGWIEMVGVKLRIRFVVKL